MKKYIFNIILVVSMGLITACNTDPDDYVVSTAPAIKLTPESLFFTSESDSVTVAVASNRKNWMIENETDWINVELRDGGFMLTVSDYQTDDRRSAYVEVVLVDGSSVGAGAKARLYVSQTGENYDVLHDGETANSYIASTERNYCFDARLKGNGNTEVLGTIKKYIADYGVDITGGQYADLLWESTLDANLTNSHNIIDGKPFYRDGKIYFTTGKSEGNAVIALKNAAGEVLWSWHIWVLTEGVTTVEGNGYMWMDRNLGAMNNYFGDNIHNRGLLYQWGRKDPFLPTPMSYVAAAEIIYAMEQEMNYTVGHGSGSWVYTDYETRRRREFPGELLYTIQNPMTFVRMFGGLNSQHYDWFMLNDTLSYSSNFWGDAEDNLLKTIFDPCPPGFRVPKGDAWLLEGMQTNEMMILGGPGAWGNTWKGNMEFYPLGGYLLAYQGYPVYCADRVRYWTRTPVEAASTAVSMNTYVDIGTVGMYDAGRSYGGYIRCVQEE